jgi:hypothetical protein
VIRVLYPGLTPADAADAVMPRSTDRPDVAG